MRCDVLVVSGHFGNTWAGNYGTTFAGRSGISLPLEELEERQCDQSCSGILGDPLEVFLLGCKTLSSAEGAKPAPRDVSAFSAHGVVPKIAARVLDEARNDGAATSSRERMQFVFAGVPRLYGFTEVAPSGERIKPLLEKYLDGIDDYAAHLRRLREASRARREVEANTMLARALEPTCFTQTSGADPTSPETARDREVCRIRDPRKPVAERLGHVERLLATRGFATYLPAIDSLLRSPPRAAFDDSALAALARIRERDHARREVLALLQTLETPVLRLQVLRVARSLGWLSAADALPAQRAIVIDLLRPPIWGEDRDFICGMGDDVLAGLDIRAEEISSDVYRDEFGIQALACLKPADDRIRARLAGSLMDSREWIARLTAVALGRMNATPRGDRDFPHGTFVTGLTYPARRPEP